MDKEKNIEEERQKILNCNHDFYGENPLRKKDNQNTAQEDVFCKNCGQHFIRIIQVYREDLFNPDKAYLGPKCKVCDFQPTVDKFVSECWLSVDISTHGPIDLIWICPDCIAKKANAN